MAVVQGIKEKVHLPLYDSITVDPEKQLRDIESSGTLKFFVNVQGKNKLETNLQSASLLPHYNTFEARAMRVVISDLPPEFSEEVNVKDEGLAVTDKEGKRIDKQGDIEGGGTGPFTAADAVIANIEFSLKRIMELLVEARETETGVVSLPADEEGVTLLDLNVSAGALKELNPQQRDNVLNAGGVILLTVPALEGYISGLDERKQPPQEQIRPNNGAGTIISKFI